MRKLCALLLMAALIAACTPSDPGEIVPTRTPLPPPTETPLPPTVTPTATAQPTFTPQPSPPPTATPATTLSTRGPWLVFDTIAGQQVSDMNGLFAVNADGTGLTQLVAESVNVLSSVAVSPASGRVAIITGGDPLRGAALSLQLVTLPSGRVTAVGSLMPDPYTPPERIDDNPALKQATYAVQSPPRWSPDGDHLVFVAFRDGSTADLYLYSLFSGMIVRLSDEEGQVFEPHWSPDGRFVAYGVKQAMDVIPRNAVDEVRVAWTNGTGDKQLYAPLGNRQRLFGWLAYDEVLVASYVPDCAYTRLRTVNVDTGAEEVLWPGHFRQAAFDAASGSVLLEAGEYDVCADGTASAESGLYLVAPGVPPQPVGENITANVLSIEWSEEQAAFVVLLGEVGQPPRETLIISPSAGISQVERPAALRASISPDGEYVVWYGDGTAGASGVWIGPVDGLPEPVFEESVEVVTWAPDSSALFFFRPPGSSDTLAYVARRPDFRPLPLAEGLRALRWVWVSRP